MGLSPLEEARRLVEERPDELPLRAVYADALTAVGDPLGEFITLQLAGQGTARERELIEKHGTRWAGPLDRLFEAKGRCFEHGFFAGGRLAKRLEPGDLAHAEWRFVTQLALALNLPHGWILKALPRLRALEIGSDLATLVEEPRSIRELRMTWANYPGQRDPKLMSPAALPKLRRLDVLGMEFGRTLAWLMELPVLAQLEVASVAAPWTGSPAWWPVLDATAIREFEVGTSNWVVRASRDGDGRLAKLAVRALGVPCETYVLSSILSEGAVRCSSVELLPSPEVRKITARVIAETVEVRPPGPR